MHVSRRRFFKLCAVGMSGSTLAMMGFSPAAALAEARTFKLDRATVTRSTCPYCSVSCGLLIYSRADQEKANKSSIFHIEGDPDHPVNRGTLCPKGAGVLDFIHSDNRLRYPEYRAAGAKEWQRISWDEAFTRIATLMKADRDQNFIANNDKGQTVNRWLTTGMLASSAANNEAGFLSVKVARGLGMVGLDTQARI